MAAHTPGPWDAQRIGTVRRISSPARIGQDIALVTHTVYAGKAPSRLDPDHITAEEADANAHLIAAAPDMLAALERCCPAQNDIEGGILRQAALAKARGQS